MRVKLAFLFFHHPAFLFKKIFDRVAEARFGNPVRAIGEGWQITACKLVRPLRSCLDPLETACNCKFNRLIVAGLKMQEWMVFRAPPIAAE